jgi:ABC-type antimicrobial peptide transport system permease subunit
MGLAIGIPAAIFAGRFMASKLYNVHPADPAVLGATTVILGLAALLAAVIPAQRAANVEPMRALRVE